MRTIDCLIIDPCPLGRKALSGLIDEAVKLSDDQSEREKSQQESPDIASVIGQARQPEFVFLIVRNWIFRVPGEVARLQQAWPESQITLGDFDLLTDALTRRRALEQCLQQGLSGFFSHLTPLAEITHVLSAAFQGQCLIARDSRPLNRHQVNSSLIRAYLSLTPRELQIFRLLVEGLSNPEIAARLGIDKRTVESHKVRIKHKFEVKSLVSLVQPEIACMLQLSACETGVAS